VHSTDLNLLKQGAIILNSLVFSFSLLKQILSMHLVVLRYISFFSYTEVLGSVLNIFSIAICSGKEDTPVRE